MPGLSAMVYDFIIVEIITSSDIKGYISIVLHAHLPFVRYPEHRDHLEERWLYEAITETYMPLLVVLENLLNDGVDFRITISLTPTLTEMLNDALLMQRYQRYLCRLLELSEREIFRTRGDSHIGPVARMYHKRLSRLRHLFEYVYSKDLTAAFGSIAASGKVELITSAATHPYLPLLMGQKTSAKAQIGLGRESFRKTFGRHPAGIWLPECGFAPGVDLLVKESGIDFFFLESHGLLNSTPPARHSIYAPVKTPAGVVVFARDAESSKQVWSASEGYPGDPNYRDFYRDIGFDLDLDYIGKYLPEGIRTFTGLKYYSITGGTGNKRPYSPEKAIKTADMHAAHFISSRIDQVSRLNERLKIKPLVTVSYDAELFGHWWFEGPEWLNFFFRKGAGQGTFRFTSPSEYIAGQEDFETVMPSMSSWGEKGYSSTWLAPSNSWIYRHLTRCSVLMARMASEFSSAHGLEERAINQASRELLLAQASDWPFMMKNGNTGDFASRKFSEHIMNFFELHSEITGRNINAERLSCLEKKNSIFRDIDFRIFSGK